MEEERVKGFLNSELISHTSLYPSCASRQVQSVPFLFLEQIQRCSHLSEYGSLRQVDYTLDDQPLIQPQVIPHTKQASAQLFLRPQLVSYRKHGDNSNNGKRGVTHFLTPIVICKTGTKRNCMNTLLFEYDIQTTVHRDIFL